jgi:ankyrin repeat protein
MYELIEKYPDAVNWRDENGATALHFAAQLRSAKPITFLLDHGADIEAVDKQGFRALHHAAQCAGDDPTAALKALLSRGAEVDARNNNGTTPLLHAVIRNKPWNVKELVIAGADENASNNTDNTPLKDARNSRGVAPQLYAAIEDGKAERLKRAEEARLMAEEEKKQSLIRDAVDGFGNGLDSAVTVMKPFRLAI